MSNKKCQPRSPTGAPTAAVEAPVRKNPEACGHQGSLNSAVATDNSEVSVVHHHKGYSVFTALTNGFLGQLFYMQRFSDSSCFDLVSP